MSVARWVSVLVLGGFATVAGCAATDSDPDVPLLDYAGCVDATAAEIAPRLSENVRRLPPATSTIDLALPSSWQGEASLDEKDIELLERAVSPFQPIDRFEPRGVQRLYRWREVLIWPGSRDEEVPFDVVQRSIASALDPVGVPYRWELSMSMYLAVPRSLVDRARSALSTAPELRGLVRKMRELGY